jgi:hypothetical protein
MLELLFIFSSSEVPRTTPRLGGAEDASTQRHKAEGVTPGQSESESSKPVPTDEDVRPYVVRSPPQKTMH